MAVIPVGSLAFSGFGDAPMKFHSPAGVDLGAPASAPVNCGAGCDGIVTLKPSGKVGVIGGNSPNFGTTGVGLFNTDFTVVGDLGSGPNGFPGDSAARDDHDQFYGCKAGSGRIFRYGISGQLADWAVNLHGDVQLVGVGANGAGTRAYYVTFSSRTSVYAWDLVGNTDLGLFASFGSGYTVRNNNIIALSNGEVLIGWEKGLAAGFVVHYSAAGAVLHTYTLGGTNPSPTALTHGLTDNTFWVIYYDGSGTSSGVSVAEINIASGSTVQTPFTPDDGAGFEYDSDITVVRVATGATGGTIPKITCLIQTISSSPAKNPGCSKGGVGFVPTYIATSGVMPVGADPTDGERLTGKRALNIWAEVTHTNY